MKVLPSNAFQLLDVLHQAIEPLLIRDLMRDCQHERSIIPILPASLRRDA
jgi:hypothetical protein